MLAQNFMTAAELGCPEWVRDSAIRVLGMLERGELVWVPSDSDPGIPNGFNMSVSIRGRGYSTVYSTVYSTLRSASGWCGTVGCIWGHIQLDAGKVWVDWKDLWNGPWAKLFTPPGWDTHPERYTVERAARTLRGFLTTGVVDWRE